MTTETLTTTFLARVEAARVEAEALDKKEAESNPRHRYYSRSFRPKTNLDRIPKPMPGTENFSFLLVRRRYPNLIIEECRRLNPEGAYLGFHGNYICVILYRGDLLIGINGKPYFIAGGKDSGKSACTHLESEGMTPEKYLTQTKQQEEQSKTYKLDREREERMKAYASLVAARSLLIFNPVLSPDGEVPQEIIMKLVRAAKSEMLNVLMRQRIVDYNYGEEKELPVEWQ